MKPMARQMEKKAEYVFTSEEELLETLSQPCPQDMKKRLIKKPRFYDEMQDDYNETYTRKKINCLPGPSFNYIQASKNKHIPLSPSNRVLNKSTTITKNVIEDTMKKTNHMLTSLDSATRASTSSNIYHDKQRDESSIRRTNCSSISPCTQTSINASNIPNCDEDEKADNDIYRKLQNTIIRKLDLIINILTNPEINQAITTDKYNLLPNFPLSTTEEFLEFEKELQTDKEIRKQFKSMIAKIGGKSYAGKTRNILKYILIDTLCQKLSWTGHKGSMAIKDTAFASILINYVSNIDKCSYHEIQKTIQEWLRHAGDRVKYAKKKEN